MIRYKLEIRHHLGEPDIYKPVILCDACSEEITDDGTVLWTVDDEAKVNGTPVYTHAGKCSRAYNKWLSDQPERTVMWERLSRMLGHLSHNVTVNN